MSTHIYPVKDTGFIINKEVSNTILAANGMAAEGKDDIAIIYAAFDLGMDAFNHCGNFAGKVETLMPDKARTPIEMNFDNGPLVYLPVAKEPKFFEPAYESAEEMLEEFQEFFASLGVEFPPEFDWWAHIVSITGTNFS